MTAWDIRKGVFFQAKGQSKAAYEVLAVRGNLVQIRRVAGRGCAGGCLSGIAWVNRVSLLECIDKILEAPHSGPFAPASGGREGGHM